MGMDEEEDALEQEELFAKDIAKRTGERRWNVAKPYVIASAVLLGVVVVSLIGTITFQNLKKPRPLRH